MAMHRKALVFSGGLAIILAARAAAQEEALVYPPHSVVHGLSLGEWGARWWQWAASMCAGNHALIDETGELAHVGQSTSPVFFLGGTFGGKATRTCKVPATELFFPLLNSPCTNYPPTNVPCGELAAQCAANMENSPVMKLTVDDREILELRNHREPFQCFHMYEPVCNPWGDPPGPFLTAQDGYYVMVKPLSPGEHTIHLRGTTGNPSLPDFETDVTYHLTVEEMSTPEEAFRRGDVDANGKVDITDAIYTLDWLFRGGPEPPCPDAADVQDDSEANVTDPVAIVLFLFSSGIPPVWPAVEFCGRDTTGDELGPCAGGCRA